MACWLHIDYQMELLTNLLHMSCANIELLVRPSMYRIDKILDLDHETLADDYYQPQEAQTESTWWTTDRPSWCTSDTTAD